MKRKFRIGVGILSCLLLVLGTACSDYFEVNPDDVLYEKDYPSSITELYSGYMGIASKVQEVADRAMILEGIRGDFLEPTEHAPSEILALYNYQEDIAGELANPRAYYAVVLNANDYLLHVEQFMTRNPASVDRATIEARSEEHTSELQSRPHLVCRLLL